jgi:hypothetical protein
MRTHAVVKRPEAILFCLLYCVPGRCSCVVIKDHQPPHEPAADLVLGVCIRKKTSLSLSLATRLRDRQAKVEVLAIRVLMVRCDHVFELEIALHHGVGVFRHSAEDVAVYLVAQFTWEAQEWRRRLREDVTVFA